MSPFYYHVQGRFRWRHIALYGCIFQTLLKLKLRIVQTCFPFRLNQNLQLCQYRLVLFVT